MRAGRLRTRVTIEANTPTVNATGEAVSAWTTYAERYAAVTGGDGREVQAAQQQIAEVTHVVEMRYLAGVTAKHRLRLGTRLFDILGVINVEEQSEDLRLLCVERAA